MVGRPFWLACQLMLGLAGWLGLGLGLAIWPATWPAILEPSWSQVGAKLEPSWSQVGRPKRLQLQISGKFLANCQKFELCWVKKASKTIGFYSVFLIFQFLANFLQPARNLLHLDQKFAPRLYGIEGNFICRLPEIWFLVDFFIFKSEKRTFSLFFTVFSLNSSLHVRNSRLFDPVSKSCKPYRRFANFLLFQSFSLSKKLQKPLVFTVFS